MKKPSWISEFKDFISRGNVIDLAVGVVIGGAFTAIVNGIVDAPLSIPSSPSSAGRLSLTR